jgi:hypothetical protein
MWHEELVHTASIHSLLQAVLDTAGTFHAITTNRYFIDGSTRRSQITTLFNSNASATCTTSGLVQTKSFGILRMHHQPSARRTIISDIQLKAIGYRSRDTDTHTEYYFKDEPSSTVFRAPLPPPKSREEVDSDTYAAPLIYFPDDQFILPSRRLPAAHTQLLAQSTIADTSASTRATSRHETLHSSRLTEIKRQAILELHNCLAHADMRICALMLGITLKDPELIGLRCAFCDIAKIHSASQGIPLHPSPHPLARIQYDSKGPLISSYREQFRYQHTVICCNLQYADVFYTKTRGEGLSRLMSWCIRANTIFKDRGRRIIDIYMDGAPENTSDKFRDWVYTNLHAELRIGAPYRHHHQHTVEGSHKILHQCQRASRVAGGMPPTFWRYAHTLAYYARMLVPTRRVLTQFKQSTGLRPLTPYENWHNTTKQSFTELHRYLYPFGCEVVAFVPIEARLTDADHGKLAIYLCPAYPNQGSLVLFLETGDVRAVATLRAHTTVFPFLNELRKRVPHALKFAPTTVEEILAPEDDSSHEESDPDYKNPDPAEPTETSFTLPSSDASVPDVVPLSPPTTIPALSVDTTIDTVKPENASDSPPDLPALETVHKKTVTWSKLTTDTLPSAVASILPMNPDVPAEPITRRSARSRTAATHKAGCSCSDCTTTETSASPNLRFPINSAVMTREGLANVHAHKGSHDLLLTWPSHHACLPSAVYTVACSKVWIPDERPDETYDSYGQRLHESYNAESVIKDQVNSDPNELIGQVLADQVALPRTYDRKWDSPYLDLINGAEDEEWKSLRDMEMFFDPIPLSDLTDDQRRMTLRLQWLYKAKSSKNGTLSRIKARLVADGSREKGQLAWWEVYAPVLVIPTLRIMLATGIQNPNARMWQCDLKNAYATADATRVIFVHFPAGRHPKGNIRYVLRLRKALYGVADSGKAFYDDWIAFHIKLGFRTIHYDRCYLELVVSENEFIRFVFHVDDNIYVQVGSKLWLWYQAALDSHYTYCMDALSYCLGIEFDIDYAEGILKMNQAAQVDKMLRELKFTSVSPVNGPNSGVQPTATDKLSPGNAKFPMSTYIGHINYIQQCTRPDLSRDLKVLSKFAVNFNDTAIAWAKKMVRYVATTRTLGIVYRRVAQELQRLLQTLPDASHSSDPDNRRSISGIVIKLGGNTILWKSVFQKIISHSSTESELMALDLSATLTVYLKWICQACGLQPIMPIPCFVDNSSTISIGTNPVQPGRNVHIHARFYYVRDLVLNGQLTIVKISTDDQLADILVSFKSYETFHRLRTLLHNCSYVALVDGVATWSTTYLN